MPDVYIPANIDVAIPVHGNMKPNLHSSDFQPDRGSKTDMRKEADQEDWEGRKAHSKSGANTGQHGMEYITRKNHSSRQ